MTGERASVSDSAGPLVLAMRGVTDLPLAVGFGISTADQVRAVGAIADGVVVGSAFERVIEQAISIEGTGESPQLLARIEALARELASGLLSKNK